MSRFAFLALLASVMCASFQTSPAAEPKPGGYSEVSVKDPEVVKAAEFAVQEHGKTAKTELVEIVTAQRQVVAGMNYKLSLKVKLDGQEKTVEAVVWSKLDKTYALTSWK